MKDQRTYPCSICSKPVARTDDATLLEAEYLDSPFSVLFYASKHIRCSPSRAQYIVHPEFSSVTDERPEYDKRKRSARVVKRDEVKYTRAWLALQQ